MGLDQTAQDLIGLCESEPIPRGSPMTITRMLLTAAAVFALLVALPTDGSDFGPDHPFAKNGGGAAGGGKGAGAAGSGDAARDEGTGGLHGGGRHHKHGPPP